MLQSRNLTAKQRRNQRLGKGGDPDLTGQQETRLVAQGFQQAHRLFDKAARQWITRSRGPSSLIALTESRKMAREHRAGAAPGDSSFQLLKNWIAIIIGIVIAYQIATLGRQGLWFDELFTVVATLPERSLTEIFHTYLLNEQTPPLHYLLMHFWQLIAPPGDWSMRVPGLFFYLLTIAAAALYPCRAINTPTRITFVALVGCSFGTIYFAQEVRTYYLLSLVAICILYDIIDHAVVLDNGDQPSWTRLTWSAMVGLIASYSHYFGYLFFGGGIFAVLCYSIARGRMPWRIVALGGAVVLGFLPWIVIQSSFLVQEGLNTSYIIPPIGVLKRFLRLLVGSPFAAALLAILGVWALSLHARAVVASRALRLTLAVISINSIASIAIFLYSPIVDARHLVGLRMATLLAFALVISEILNDWRAQALLIATAATLFASFIMTQQPKQSWREPAAYIIDHTTCERREILFYAGLGLPAWALSYYLPVERFPLKYSKFDSSVVQDLGQLNEARPGCDVVAIALHLGSAADWQAALAATPFRGPGFHLQEWPSAFVVRQISQ